MVTMNELADRTTEKSISTKLWRCSNIERMVRKEESKRECKKVREVIGY